MKKKLIAIILSLTTVLGATAFAGESITAQTKDNSVVFQKEAWMNEQVVLSCYDNDGKLKYSNLYKAQNDEFNVNIPSEFKDMRIRAYFKGNEDIRDVVVSTPTPSPIPTPSPQPTETPSKYPSIYEKAVDAVNAFAVVKSVLLSYVNEEEVYEVNALYQGKEIKLYINKDITFSSASDEFSYMIGTSPDSLKEGDVIHFTAGVSGKIKDLHFILRPLKDDIITSESDFGANFDKLISSNGVVAGQNGWVVAPYGKDLSVKNQFAFGVITSKNAKSLTLLNKSGKDNDAQYLSIQDDTIVYICDMSKKGEVSIGTVSDITKSSIPSLAYDSDKNVTYSKDYSYNYALARIINGTVTDIVVYTNYNE